MSTPKKTPANGKPKAANAIRNYVVLEELGLEDRVELPPGDLKVYVKVATVQARNADAALRTAGGTLDRSAKLACIAEASFALRNVDIKTERKVSLS